MTSLTTDQVLPPLSATNTTLYSSLATELKEAILRGDYPEGQRLPTELELCEFKNVSRQTVRRAYKELVDSGLVHRIPGRGTFVSQKKERERDRYSRHFDSIEDSMSLSKDTQMQVLEPLRRRIDLNAAGRLQTPENYVYRSSFLRIFEGTPIVYGKISWPVAVGEQLAELPEIVPGQRTEKTFIGLIENQLGIFIAESRQSYSATLADAEIAADLDCNIGDPLLQIDRLHLDKQGNPVQLTISYLNPELYSYESVMYRDEHAVNQRNRV